MSRRELLLDYPFRLHLKQLREEKKMTQKQVGNAVGLSPITVSGWEIGKSLPDIQTLPLLADLFGVTIDSLLGQESPPHPIIIPNAAFVPVFETLRFRHGQLQCLGHQGTHPVPSDLQEAAGPGGILFVTAPDGSFQDAGIRPGDRVALFIGLPFVDGELCGVCIGRQPLRLLRVNRLPDGIELRSEKKSALPVSYTGKDAESVHIVGPYAGSWRVSPRMTK